MKPIVLTVHAAAVVEERSIDFGWIERAVRVPDWSEQDRLTAGAERRFGLVPERGDRFLRVVCIETGTEIRILTVFLDRKAKRPV